MDKEELELQYSPSRWSHRFDDPDEVIKKHVEIAKSESINARNIPVEREVRYGRRKYQLLDVFGGSTLPNDAPILVYVHGGYWQDLSRDLSAYCVLPQFESGIRVVIVGYDLAPSVTVGIIIEEIREAATYVVNLATKQGSRSVWFAGHSAGAHLVSMLLFSGWLDQLNKDLQECVKGLILISGVFDLTPLVNTYVNEPLNLTREEARSYSPLLLKVHSLIARTLQILIVVGMNDSPEFQHQSRDFFQKLKQIGLQVQLNIIEDVDHFDIVEKLHLKEYSLTKKILRLIKE